MAGNSYNNLLGKPQKDTILGGLYLHGSSTVGELKDKLINEGVIRKNNKWNYSRNFMRYNNAGLAVQKNKSHWELTTSGKRYVEKKFGFNKKKQEFSEEITTILNELDKDNPNYSYVKEFSGCFEHGYLKATLIMAWSGAIWILRNHIASDQKLLEAFNEAGRSKFNKNNKESWKNIKNVEGFEEKKDKTLLDVSRDAGIFSKSFINKMSENLQLRNNCGHPSSIETGKNEIMNAIEFLVLNVYKKYSL